MSAQGGRKGKRKASSPKSHGKRCRFYATSRGCQWGDKCRFVHDASTSQLTSTAGCDEASAKTRVSVSSSAAEPALIPGFYFDAAKGKYFALKPGQRQPQMEPKPAMLALPERSRGVVVALVSRGQLGLGAKSRREVAVAIGRRLCNHRHIVAGPHDVRESAVFQSPDGIVIASVCRGSASRSVVTTVSLSGLEHDGDRLTGKVSGCVSRHHSQITAATDIRWHPETCLRNSAGVRCGKIVVCDSGIDTGGTVRLLNEWGSETANLYGELRKTIWTADWLVGGELVIGGAHGFLMNAPLAANGPSFRLSSSRRGGGVSDVMRVRRYAGQGSCAIVGQRCGQVFVCDIRESDGRLPRVRLGSSATTIEVMDTNTTLLASTQGHLILWDVRMPLCPLVTYDGHVNSRTHGLPISFSSSLGLVAGGGEDGTVRLWDLAHGGRPLQHIAVGDEPVRVAALTPQWGHRRRAGLLASAGDVLSFSDLIH